LPDGGGLSSSFRRKRTVVAPADTGIGIAGGQRKVIAVVGSELRKKGGALARRHQPVEKNVAEARGLREHHGNVHVACRDLLHHETGCERVGAGAARFLGKRQGAQTQLRGLVERIGQERLVERLQAIRMQGRGPDLALDEIAQRIAEFELLRGETEIVHREFLGLGDG
jgi:hypothetical protein